MGIKPTPEQRQAMDSLKAALTLMYDRGFGSDGVKAVLEENFPEICNEMGGGTSDRDWHRKNTDPYYRMTPGEVAASWIVSGKE
jgi:hypothetical protein